MKRVVYFFFILSAACNVKKNEPAAINQAGRTPSEEKSLKELTLKYPDSLILRENLIQYFRDQGSYQEAIQEVDAGIKRDSVNARLWNIRATLLFENEDTVNAIRSFEKAISLLPDPGYILSLGTIYAQAKNPASLQLADALIKPKSGARLKEAYFIKGLYYAFTNEKAKAIAFFDKCLSLNYTFMDAYREKSIALYDLGKYEEALAVLDKAITLQNNFEEGYYYSGKCLEKLDRKEEAIQSYKNALLYDADYMEAKDALVRLGIK